MEFIVLDTLGKLVTHGVGLSGLCNTCASGYWEEVRARRMPKPSSFDVDLAALIAERGDDCRVVGLAAVACPRCGSRDTETRLSVPHRK
jgi:hypothetical protein